jgi:hypothetical protein
VTRFPATDWNSHIVRMAAQRPGKADARGGRIGHDLGLQVVKRTFLTCLSPIPDRRGLGTSDRDASNVRTPPALQASETPEPVMALAISHLRAVMKASPSGTSGRPNPGDLTSNGWAYCLPQRALPTAPRL